MLKNIEAMHGEKVRSIIIAALPDAPDARPWFGYYNINTEDKYRVIACLSADIVDDLLAANIGRYLEDPDPEPDGEEEV